MDFDLNEYFNIFGYIRINQGFALGYVYYDRSSLGGRPIIYHACQEQTPYDDYEAYEKAAGGRAAVSRKIVEREFIHAIQTDDVPEAFFELAVFCELAGNFYLYWHDLDVDKIIIVSTGDIEDVFLKTENEHWRIPLTSKQKRRARKIKTFPEVEMGDDVVRVSLTYFRQSGGFYRGNYYFERTFPHRLLKVERENLVLAASQAL